MSWEIYQLQWGMDSQCDFVWHVEFNVTGLVQFITARKRSLGLGNCLTRVCHSVHRGAHVWCHFLSGCLVPCSFQGCLCPCFYVPSRGSLSRGLCPSGLCTMGFCLGVSVHGYVSGGLCPGSLCPGVSVWGYLSRSLCLGGTPRIRKADGTHPTGMLSCSE